MRRLSQYATGNQGADFLMRTTRVGVAGIILFGGTAFTAVGDEGGQRSFANIEQISDILARASLAQAGIGNQVEILQEGEGLVVNAYVQGQLNKAVERANTVTQRGDGAVANVQVTGDQNQFSIDQSASDAPGRNDASLIVEGDYNTASIQQTNDFGEAFFNTASIVQTGNGNIGAIVQTISPGDSASGGNTASIVQDGDDNDALIEQTGADNSAAIEQDGSDNQGRILQDGEGLSAVLVQSGAALEYTINQTGCVITSGCGSVVVTQSGP